LVVANGIILDPKCDILVIPDGVLGAGEAMRRREFIAFVSSTAAAWPLAAGAQQSALQVVGFLNAASPNMFAQFVPAFRVGLNETGYVEGWNVTIEYRWAGGQQYDRLPALAAELVDRRVSVIATGSNTVAAKAAKAATTIPIIFLTGPIP
jgi:putative tryptophan/tyrosine transport system substrate-binding protein